MKGMKINSKNSRGLLILKMSVNGLTGVFVGFDVAESIQELRLSPMRLWRYSGFDGSELLLGNFSGHRKSV